MKLLWTFWLTLIVASTAIGCGGSATNQQTSTSVPVGQAKKSSSKPAKQSRSASEEDPIRKQFIAQAEAICKHLNAELIQTSASNTTPQTLARVVPTHVVVERFALNELAKLKTPISILSVWQKMLAYRRTLVVELDQLANAARSNDVKRIQALTASKQRMHKRLSAAAAKGGFKECGQIG